MSCLQMLYSVDIYPKSTTETLEKGIKYVQGQ